MDLPSERWVGRIEEVELGRTKTEGGTRARKIKVGGENTLPCLRFEGSFPNKPAIAMEVYDLDPQYPEALKEIYSGVLDDPVAWARKCVGEYKADLVGVRLESTNPETKNTSAEDSAELIEEILKAVDVPLIIAGSGNEEKDAQVIGKCAEAAQRESCLLGFAEVEKYKSVAAAALAYNHSVISFSNIDFNLAKQTNILLTEFGLEKNRIVIDPLASALGYGLEYTYSVIERIRVAALQGDEMLQMPIICNTGSVWGVREVYTMDERLGDFRMRGVLWEAETALSYLTAGADILVMQHPEAVGLLRKAVGDMFQ